MRTIVFDLDGTLLAPFDHEGSEGGARPVRRVRPAVIEAMRGFRRRGGRVLLASSRPPRSVARIAAGLELAEEPSIALNGAVIVEDGQLRAPKSLPPGTTGRFLAEVEDLYPFVYSGWSWLVPRWGPPVDAEVETVGFTPVQAEDLADLEPVQKLTANAPSARLDALEAALDGLSGTTRTRPSRGSLELMAEGVDKGQALRDLEIPAEGLVAVGNGDNDVGMLRFAELGVAMGDGSEAVREAADRVVGPHDSDTLAELLDELAAEM